MIKVGCDGKSTNMAKKGDGLIENAYFVTNGKRKIIQYAQ
jgi:hypothetical protein